MPKSVSATPYSLPLQMRQLQQACAAHGYAFSLLDTHSGYVCNVAQGTKQLVLGVGPIQAFPLNSATAASLAADKGYTALVLQQAGLSVPEGDYFFIDAAGQGLRQGGKGVPDAVAYADTLGYPVMVKPLKGSRGNGVQPVFDEADLRKHLARLAPQHYAAILQRPAVGAEYRIFVLDGLPRFLYRKQAQPQHFATVADFHNYVKMENEHRSASGLLPYDWESGYLRSLAQAVAEGRSVAWGALSVASGHSEVVDFTVAVPEAWEPLVQQMAKAFPLRVFACDLILTQGTVEQPEAFAILEVNANPMLNSAEEAAPAGFVTELWGEILEKSFAAMTA